MRKASPSMRRAANSCVRKASTTTRWPIFRRASRSHHAAGCAACGCWHDRTLAAIYKVPERATFVRLLDFCRTPRKLADINQLLADDPALAPSQRTAVALHACYFIDRLEEAGGGVEGRILGHYRCGKRALASV